LKTVLRLADGDVDSVAVHGNSFVFRSNQANISKSCGKYTFDQIFASDATTQQICSVCLPDLLQTCFSGSDACFIYFGAVSKAKNELLYSRFGHKDSEISLSAKTTTTSQLSLGAPYPGIFPSALLLTFRLISELRQRRPDFRHSVRISALYYSQRRNMLTDLLAPLIRPSSGSRQDVIIREDSVLGIKIENHSELRVDSIGQAFILINEIVRIRLNGKYKKDTSQLIGGRSRLCLVDLGLGERTSKGDTQMITMPVITNLLVALFQGQRYLPSRQELISFLMLKNLIKINKTFFFSKKNIKKKSLGSVQVKTSLLFASLSDRMSESDNILQMMSKIQRAAKPRKAHRIGSDSSSSDCTRRRLAASSEGNSSSEQSCAETVIFLGPSVRVESPEQEVNVSIQCNENDIDIENIQLYGYRRQLDDILEDDEETSICHSPRSLATAEQLLDPFQNNATLKQPLSILSLDKISASTSGKSASENEVEDDDLERAMAASISSIRSHEILSQSEEFGSLGIYRRASQLEAYADEKLRQLNESYEKKKKKRFVPLNCCRSTMMSSGSSGGYVKANTSRSAEKEDTVENSKVVIATNAISPSSEHLSVIMKSNDSSITVCKAATVPRSITHPLSSNRSETTLKSKLPRRVSEGNTKKAVSPDKQITLPEHTGLQTHNTKNTHRDLLDSKKDIKKGKRLTERRSSEDADRRTMHSIIPSPYSRITDAKKDTGTYSSGHGSDENGSIYSKPPLTLLSPRCNRPRNRESFSASSGYESATGVDIAKNRGSFPKRRLFKLSWTNSSEKFTLPVEKQISTMISKQNRLRDDLRDAKHLLGVADEHFLTASTSTLQGATLLEALTQETKILEKRLIACRNHAMIVTCLL
ncbi:unnamed protein product, partial [Thelazia callipaeda]|uniref:Kinesin motor domain-containing protein n=1 Tax=Thelazia callipaeda TaxID=103827 RepID=A0A0N5D6U5_THECL